jgi:hypothetical protein
MEIELMEVGRKVSKSRLERLKTAFKSLSDLIAEVDDDDKADEKAESMLPVLFYEASAVVKKGDKFILFEDGVKKGEFDDEDKATEALKKLRGKAAGGTADVTESSFEGDVEISGGLVLLEEKAVRADGTTDVLIASPGWGSHGYYSQEVLERDGPTVWPKGTHMYWNHPTETEKRDRPERDLRDLAAVTESMPVWKDSGPAGPGLYVQAKVNKPYQEAVNELAPHIGTSLRAFGSTKFGEVEGRKGPIVEKLIPTPHNSIDFVTLAGRGGKVMQLFESARGGEFQHDHKEDPPMLPGSKELQEANTKIARLTERWLIREARDFVAAKLKGAPLPDVTKVRLQESLGSNPPVKEGELDTEALDTRIEEAVKDEAQYLADAAGFGTPRGMGLSESDRNKDLKPDEFQEALGSAMGGAWGLDEKQAKQAVLGRGRN